MIKDGLCPDKPYPRSHGKSDFFLAGQEEGCLRLWDSLCGGFPSELVLSARKNSKGRRKRPENGWKTEYRPAQTQVHVPGLEMRTMVMG